MSTRSRRWRSPKPPTATQKDELAQLIAVMLPWPSAVKGQPQVPS